MIKKPTGLSKPAGIKKPNVKKPVVAKPIEAKVEEEKVVEPIAIIENPVDVAPELLEQMIEEENQKLEEQDAMEEVPLDEVLNDPEPVVEEKPKAKKSSRKSTKKKEEPKVEEPVAIQEELPQMSLFEAVERMEADVNITLPEWEEQKLEIQDKLKALTIDPDANPTIMKNLIGDLDELLCELRFLLSDVEDQVEALNSHIEYIRVTHAKGTNAEERKAAGYFALVNHKKDPADTEVINLIQYQNFMNSKLRFVNNAVKTVESRQKLLITFSSMIKVEANL